MPLPLSLYPASTLMFKRGMRFLNYYRHIQQVCMQGKVASSANWQMLEQKGRGEGEGMSRTHSLARAVKLMGLPSTMLACVSVPFTRSLPADPFPQLHTKIRCISMSVSRNIGYTMSFLSTLYLEEISKHLCRARRACGANPCVLLSRQQGAICGQVQCCERFECPLLLSRQQEHIKEVCEMLCCYEFEPRRLQKHLPGGARDGPTQHSHQLGPAARCGICQAVHGHQVGGVPPTDPVAAHRHSVPDPAMQQTQALLSMPSQGLQTLQIAALGTKMHEKGP